MQAKKQRLLSPTLLMFMGTMILANIAAQMIMPLESLYVQDLGANVEQVGLFFTMAAIAPLLFQLFGGWLSDSIGRLQAIAIGSMGGALSYLFYILAPTWVWLLPASILTAMAVAFVAPSFQAFVAEESTEETRGRVYGITSTMFMVVNIVGPLVGGLVAQGLSFRAMYIAAGALYGTAAVIRVLMARHASRKSRERGTPVEKPSLTGFRKSLAAVLGLLLAGGVVTWIFVSDGVRDVAFSLTGRADASLPGERDGAGPAADQRVAVDHGRRRHAVHEPGGLAVGPEGRAGEPRGWFRHHLGGLGGLSGGQQLLALCPVPRRDRRRLGSDRPGLQLTDLQGGAG